MVTHRGHIKKIKFGPGRGNNKLAALYSDGIDIWDLQKVGYSGGSRGEVQGGPYRTVTIIPIWEKM